MTIRKVGGEFWGIGKGYGVNGLPIDRVLGIDRLSIVVDIVQILQV